VHLFLTKGRILVASWSNMGGWKDNAHILSRKEVCKTLWMIAPRIWGSILNALFGEPLMCPFHPVSKEKWFPFIGFMWSQW